jgi:2-oxoglutarate dehydrogenase E1 component
MYAAIEKKESVYKIYSDKLVAAGVLDRKDVDAMLAEIHAELEAELQAGRAAAKRPMPAAFAGVWAGYQGGPDSSVPEVDTGVDRARLEQVATICTKVPDGFTPHPKIVQLLKRRLQMGKGEAPLDWAMGELMAFGSLVQDKTLVRLSGQDSCRGTFSQRHAVVVDVRTGEEYIPLKTLASGADLVRIYDSALSEAGVLGFEFGYSLDYPDGLIMWEAQFGDFVNGAQVIIDQFLASSEDKWKRTSGLVLLLPHGYEGQGPEHSSARPERFLELCAEDNMQVVYPTTPAQYFHVLRRQVVRKWRKPLIVLTPKSLLRHPEATSSLDELTRGRFQRVIPDATAPATTTRALLCSGKVYYDLVEERKKRNDQTTAILRIEQLYPWRDDDVQKALAAYPKLAELVWVQEEPSNGGAFSFIEPRLRRVAGTRKLRLVSRAESASPATGSHKAHVIEQRALVEQAFTS